MPTEKNSNTPTSSHVTSASNYTLHFDSTERSDQRSTVNVQGKNNKTKSDDSGSSSGKRAGIAVLIVICCAIIIVIVLWFAYAYTHPHTKSGMFLIQVFCKVFIGIYSILVFHLTEICCCSTFLLLLCRKKDCFNQPLYYFCMFIKLTVFAGFLSFIARLFNFVSFSMGIHENGVMAAQEETRIAYWVMEVYPSNQCPMTKLFNEFLQIFYFKRILCFQVIISFIIDCNRILSFLS